MPTTQPDLARTLLGVPVVVAVLSNDEGAGLDVVGYTQPAAGTLALNPDQSFTFTPAPGFEGTDSFTYKVRDAAGGTAEGEVRIVVARPNTAPIARPDSAQVTAGGDVAMAVLANDNDPDGDALALLGIDAPGHGTIRVEAGQTIRYTPQRGFSGIDSFTYTVGDGRGGVSMATVTVAVVNPNTPPVAAPDAASTVAGTPVIVDVLANDNDPDGDRVELAGLSLPGHGTLNLTPERRVAYTPAAGFVGADSFTYTVADAHGAKAEGVVRVEVERRNAPPVATPDSIASSGEPVTFDLLANDNDPDGDSLRLTALTLPVKGRIAVNPSGTVTYTPPQGFTGNDSFAYRVTDGTAEAEAEVTVAVTAPQVPTYANGYRYRRRLVVPPQAPRTETVTDFVLLVREQGDWLRSAASGGRVQSELGHDLRFELEDGTKLDHELERYQPATGSVVAWVSVPTFDLASQLRLFLYHGKPGLAAGEANPAGVWRGYLAVYDARTGTDRSGQGRSLTPSNVAAGELIGEAGAYGGSAVASRADASFLAGHAALTVQAVTAPDASMLGSDHGLLAQGPMDGTDGSAGLTLQYLRQSSSGAANVIHFKLACSDGAAFVVSGGDAQRAEPQILHGVWRQGQAPALFVNGAPVQPSSVSAARSGVSSMPPGGLYLGAGARDPASGGWRGLIDEVRIAASALSAARIASEAANLATPQALYGLGDQDQAGESDQAPVAVPIKVVTTAATHVDVDVAAAAYDPDGPGPCEVLAAGSPAHGVVTVTGGTVRYTPLAGFAGSDWFSYTLDNAGKRSTSCILVQVEPAANTTEHPFDAPEWSGTFTAQRYVSPSGTGTGLTASAPMSWADGVAWLTGGNCLTLLPGRYGSRALAKTFPDGKPGVIRALNRAVAMPATWGGAETVAASAQRSSFAGLEVAGRNVILDGLELLAKSGPARHSNAGRQLWRNCYVNGVDGAESTQILVDIDEGTGHTVGVRDCYFHKPRTAGAGTGDYGLRIHETHGVWVLRCLWDGSWVHGLSWKNRSSGGVLDCHFRACGSLDMDVGQSPDWTSAGSSVPEENSCTTIVIRRNRFAGAGLKRNGAPYCALRVKNVETCEITDNVFLGSLEIPIHVNYLPRAGGLNLSGTHQTSQINNLGPPRPDQLTIDRNSFAGGKVILNCRGRAAEVIRFRGNTGAVLWARYGRFNPENITSEAGIPMHPTQIDLDAYPAMEISGNAFPVTKSTTLLG